MKVLIYDSTCAFLTPGGKTTHALKLRQEIAKLGVKIEFARWWDVSQQDADIVHFLSIDTSPAASAKAHGKKTFYSMIFDYETNKSRKKQVFRILKNRILDTIPRLSGNRYWRTLQFMDRVQFMHTADRDAAFRYFPKLLSSEKTVIIPHAYDPSDMYISDGFDIHEWGFPEKYLVSCATISARKQSVLLARLARMARVPVVFMGSRNEYDPYYLRFREEVDNRFVFDPGFVSREWRDCIERNASGFVLLSQGESGCIAVYEAAAYKLPLLLSNLPWAKCYEDPTDIFFCDYDQLDIAVQQLNNFYDKAGPLDHMPFRAKTWGDVAKMYVKEYESLLREMHEGVY